MEEYRLKRHTALWEMYNKRIRRMVVGGILFAMLILFNVSQPYTQRINELRQDMAQFIDTREQAIQAKDRIQQLQTQLDQLHPLIEQMPWMQRAYDLMQQFRDMNRSGAPINRADYQKEANATILAVANQVKQDVIQPLSPFFNPPDTLLVNQAPQLIAEFNRLPQAIDNWVADNHNKEWYLTQASKLQQIEILTDDLYQKLKSLITTSKNQSDALRKIQFSLVSRYVEMQQKEKETEQKLTAKLDGDMARVIPTWVSGIISIRQIIYGYPFAVLILSVYVFILAYQLPRHFDALASAEGIKPEHQHDPMMSSLWTLSYRGHLGTATTLVAYLIFFILTGWFFEQGIQVLHTWIGLDREPLFSTNIISLIQWMGRLIFLGILVGIFHRVYRAYQSFVHTN